MGRAVRQRGSAFTLAEVALVTVLLVLLVSIVAPRLVDELRRDALPRSARQLRSLLTLVRAHAALEGKRYRIRFPLEDEDEANLIYDDRQPIIERENDPVFDPEQFDLVTDPWVLGKTFLEGVWCARVRLGRPTIAKLQEERRRGGEEIQQQAEQRRLEDFDPIRPPLIIEPDGTSEWATFVLTTAPRETDVSRLEDYPQIDVIYEGETGMAWLQRPFYESELDLFAEKGWPAVLRQDFLDPRELTEDDVLEIRETLVRGYDVEQKGQELAPAEAKPEEAAQGQGGAP
ncbi:MAG: hypothetical protein D6788_01570 [Planctomycetota bacterium]|nr:MAG: hypothetical protein D6788_01570 [Planctomycetota bacterium]